MKKHLLLIILFAVAVPVMAQHDGSRRPDKKKPAAITELVSDLNAVQKRKIDNISQKTKERLDVLRTQQHAVRDSIAMYMDLDGDQSRYLYPLFDREGQLKAAVSREMYTTKIRIDEVLTPAQRAELRKRSKK